MTRHLHVFLALTAVAFATGCPAVPVTTTEKTTAAAGGGRTQDKSAIKARALEFIAKGPTELATGGKIISEAGGSALTTPVAFRVNASSASFAPVAKGVLKLTTFAGDQIYDDVDITEGTVAKISVPEGRPLTASAIFTIGGVEYRVAAVIVDGRPTAPLELNPVQAMIEARVRELSTRVSNPRSDADRARRILPNLEGVTFDMINRVNEICDKANVAVEKEALKSERTAKDPGEAQITLLSPVWTRETAAKVTVDSEKTEINSFVSSIRVLAQQ